LPGGPDRTDDLVAVLRRHCIAASPCKPRRAKSFRRKRKSPQAHIKHSLGEKNFFPGSWDGMSVAGAFADAPPIIAKETPAAAHTGKAVFER
jgi:hypothetical protein